MKGWTKIFNTNGKQKSSCSPIYIRKKIDCKSKAVIKYKEVHYIMIKGSIAQDAITIVNIYESKSEYLHILNDY